MEIAIALVGIWFIGYLLFLLRGFSDEGIDYTFIEGIVLLFWPIVAIAFGIKELWQRNK